VARLSRDGREPSGTADSEPKRAERLGRIAGTIAARAAGMGHTRGMPDSAGATHTWDDFVMLDEDDLRELIDGELVEVEVPTGIHEFIVAMLVHRLMGWALPRRAGFALASGFKVRITNRRGVMPDVQFFRAGSRDAERRPQGLVGGHPDLVVEVVSPSSARYDRVIKLRYYASIGVPEYWIIDPGARTLERLVLREQTYLIAEVASDDDVLRPQSFEELEIPLSELWVIPGDGGAPGPKA
jgi:Uma2 family endonuclease